MTDVVPVDRYCKVNTPRHIPSPTPPCATEFPQSTIEKEPSPKIGLQSSLRNHIIQERKQFTSKMDSFVILKKRKVSPVFYQWVVTIWDNGEKAGMYKCNPALNSTLELEFRKGSKNHQMQLGHNKEVSFDIKEGAVKPIQDLSSSFEYRLERRVLVAGRHVQLPKYWNPTQSHTCQLFEVETDSKEFKDIQETVKETLPQAKIKAIQRIQNLLVYQRYYTEIPRVELASGERNEKFLFHGTRNVSPGTIISCQEGFDTRLAGNQNLWGPAAYFAEDAKYVDAFAFRTFPDTKQIIVASVTLGACFDYGQLCNPSLRQPPINIKTKQRFNSVSGVTKDSRVYAVFNSAQCCPRYIVKYESG